MKKFGGRKILAILIVLMFILGMIPAEAIAADSITTVIYEAEDGINTGGARNLDDPNTSGGYYTAYLDSGASNTINGADGGAGGEYTLTIRYAAAGHNRTMSLYVDGVHTGDLTFPSTGGYTLFSELKTTIILSPGPNNAIMLQVDGGDFTYPGSPSDTGDINIDYYKLDVIDTTEPVVTPGIYEAEYGTNAGGARNLGDPGASAGHYTAYLDSGASNRINGADGGAGGNYTLIIRYAAADHNRTMSLYINGVNTGGLTFPSTGGYTSFSDFKTAVTLNPGPINAIMLQVDGGTSDTGDINIDCYKLDMIDTTEPVVTPGKYEAEYGINTGGARNIGDPSASAGHYTAYLDNGASNTISGADGGSGGEYTLTIRYAAAQSDRTISLYVGGVHNCDLTFPSTGGYTTFSDLKTTVTLNPGPINSIMLQVDGSDSGDINIDYYKLDPSAPLEPASEIEAQICAVKDNKQAIWTFTTDDGIYNSVLKYNDLFKMYGLKGTVGLISGSVGGRYDDGINSFYCGTWDEWTQLLSDGCFDIANHSYTHHPLAQIPASELDNEINGARTALMQNLSGQLILGFITPYGNYNDSVASMVAQQHYANRGITEGDNSLNPDDYLWYNLRSYSAVQGVSTETMNGWLDSVIANNSWCIEVWHGIDSEADARLWEPSTSEICSSHMSYVASNLNLVWNATYTEAIQYIRERQNATLSVLSSDTTKIELSLSDNLDDSLFNYPLTLKVQVPNEWTGANINGITSALTPVTESGKNFLYFDAVPDHGNIVILGITG